MLRLRRKICVVLSIPVVLLVFTFSGQAMADQAKSGEINCDIQKGSCTMPVGDVNVTLDITPRPVKAMEELVFSVKIDGAQPESLPFIDLGMPAMKMGPNRVKLEKKGADDYTGKGIIVRCKSGKTIWFANVTVPGKGEVKFIFDVVY